MEKLKTATADATAENIEKIAALFPNCVTEAADENGQPRRAIDWDALRQELQHDIVEGKEERYRFTWPGKREAVWRANTPTNSTLRPCRAESQDFDTTANLYIEGDNLEVLKVLKKTYQGKIKMIYIDPPYNTGNDFVYNDKYAEEQRTFEEKSHLRDTAGRRLVSGTNINRETDGKFHSNWLNMMYPRLRLAHGLLSEGG